MKVLLLSCSTGGGHDAAARAIMEKLNEFDVETQMLNSYTLKSKRFAKTVDTAYLDIIAAVPSFFKGIFKFAEFISSSKIKSPVYGINRFFRKPLDKYIVENDFDLVIATHVFQAQILTSVKKKKPNLKFIFIVTDYTFMPFSNEIDPDYIVIPSKLLKEKYLKRKVKKEKILTFGIPISPKFEVTHTKKDARKHLSLPINKKIVLIMTGSTGFGKVENTIETIQNNFKDVHIVTICGNNEKLKDKLSFGYENLTAVGFTKEVNIYLDACDVVLTKPGGLTSTEIASKNVPVIFTDPIPGIENYNANFFKNLNMAYVSENSENLVEYLDELLNNKWQVTKMKINQSKYINKNSTKDLVKFILKKYK